LLVADGLGPRRREGQFFRASSPIKRLVLIGRSGAISLESVAWLHDTRASLIHLDCDGTVLLCSAAWGYNDGRLRRQQALATTNGVGITIARSLAAAKLRGQRDLLRERGHPLQAVTSIETALARVNECSTSAELMRVEAEAAAAYWRGLAPTQLTFARRDLSRIPPHWLTLGARTSPITRSPRRAASPGQALINLAYGAATAEASIACATLGIDAAVGVLHSDLKARDSLALDLLEPCRPAVDRYILNLIDTTAFAARDFREDRKGQVWVTTRLARHIAETCPLWAQELAPVAEHVAKTLAATRESPLSAPTLLTQEARRAGRNSVRRRRHTPVKPTRPAPPRICRECGTALDRRDRTYCNACLPEARDEQRLGFAASGPAALARLRKAGSDPAHGGAAANRRAATMRKQQRERADWQPDPTEVNDPAEFTREILPHIQNVPLRRLSAETGLSLRYVALIRRGERVPHPRHWQAFAGAGLLP
jgi:CRISPR-associated protein Cas1